MDVTIFFAYIFVVCFVFFYKNTITISFSTKIVLNCTKNWSSRKLIVNEKGLIQEQSVVVITYSQTKGI